MEAGAAMNRDALKKNAWSRVRIRPKAKRFFGEAGPQLPPVDDDWMIQDVGEEGVRISNSATGHGTVLGYDHIHHFMSDPARGARSGFLILNVQIHIGGNRLWIEPTCRPGEALADPFEGVQHWSREGDVAYLQRAGFI